MHWQNVTSTFFCFEDRKMPVLKFHDGGSLCHFAGNIYSYLAMVNIKPPSEPLSIKTLHSLIAELQCKFLSSLHIAKKWSGDVSFCLCPMLELDSRIYKFSCFNVLFTYTAKFFLVQLDINVTWLTHFSHIKSDMPCLHEGPYTHIINQSWSHTRSLLCSWNCSHILIFSSQVFCLLHTLQSCSFYSHYPY